MNIKELAKRAGVSVGTVSNVLGNKGNVSAEYRMKVLEAAKQMGYEPKPRGYRHPPLIAICAERQSTLSDHELPPFNAEVTVSLLAAAEESEVDVVFYTGTRLAERRRDPKFYLSQPFDALVAFFPHGDQFRETLKAVGEHRPVVVMFGGGFEGTVSGIKARNYEIGRLAANYLIGQGYKRFYYVPAPDENEDSDERGKGFSDGITQESEAPVRLPKISGVKPKQEDDRYPPWGMEYAEAVGQDLRDYAAEEDSPVGVFVFADPLGVDLLSWSSPDGKQPGRLGVPSKVGIIGCDDLNLGRGLLDKVGLTSIPQSVEDISRGAIQAALDLIAGAPKGRTETIAEKPKVDPRWSTERTRD